METINQVVTNVHQAYTAVPSGFWSALGASGVLSPLLVMMKQWLAIEAERKYTVFWLGRKINFTGEQVMLTLLGIGAGLMSSGQYILATPTANPTIIALHAAIISFMSQPVYYFVVKPLQRRLGKVYAQAQALNLAKQSAKVPADGLPLSQQ